MSPSAAYSVAAIFLSPRSCLFFFFFLNSFLISFRPCVIAVSSGRPFHQPEIKERREGAAGGRLLKNPKAPPPPSSHRTGPTPQVGHPAPRSPILLCTEAGDRFAPLGCFWGDFAFFWGGGGDFAFLVGFFVCFFFSPKVSPTLRARGDRMVFIPPALKPSPISPRRRWMRTPELDSPIARRKSPQRIWVFCSSLGLSLHA